MRVDHTQTSIHTYIPSLTHMLENAMQAAELHLLRVSEEALDMRKQWSSQVCVYVYQDVHVCIPMQLQRYAKRLVTCGDSGRVRKCVHMCMHIFVRAYRHIPA